MSSTKFENTQKQMYSEGIYLHKRIETNASNQIIETVVIYTNEAGDVLIESFFNVDEKAVQHFVSVYDENSELRYELCYDGEGNYTDGYDFVRDDSFLSLEDCKLKDREMFQRFDLEKFLYLK
jgi:hypothetical protein